MKRIVRSIALAVVGFAVIHAHAQEGQRPAGRPEGAQRREGGDGGGRGGPMMRMNPLMQALDTDKNGELSAAEIANASAALKALDKNGDGKLSADELRPAGMEGERGGPRADNNSEAITRMMAYDKNGDGKLSAKELPDRMRGMIARGDTDKDGFISKAELTKLMTAQNSGRGPGGEGERRPEGGKRQ